jgi:hypothetical protein
MKDQLVARSLTIDRTTQTQNKRTQKSMSRVGFEPAIRAFERAKTSCLRRRSHCDGQCHDKESLKSVPTETEAKNKVRSSKIKFYKNQC